MHVLSALRPLLLLSALTHAAPVSNNDGTPLIPNGPAIASDFADPSIIHIDGTWYAFATQSRFDHPHIRVQLATSDDFDTWKLTETDAMVDHTNPRIWAPDVHRRKDGTFIMFFAATALASPRGFHCIGTAISDTVTGPYHSNSDTPFACPLDRGGAIDPSGSKDPDSGQRYVLYKIDANALGHGGTCGNTVEPMVSTPIMIQRVSSDWTTPLGPPKQILDRGPYDGPLIEAPTMIKKHGIYYLFFSSNCYYTPLYDVSYATSLSATGGFVKTHTPLLVTGTVPGVAGPGHADVTFEGGVHGFSWVCE